MTSSVTAALEELQRAAAAGDMQAVCRHLTGSAHRQAGTLAHGLPTLTCRRDLRRAFKIISNGLDGTLPTVTHVTGHGGAAKATLKLPDSPWRAQVPLIQNSGRWKLAGFFGASDDEVTAIERTAQERPFPDPPVHVVRAMGPDASMCGELSESSYPDIAGGCTLKVAAPKVAVQMLTPFGTLDFGECNISYRLSIDAQGRTWTDRWAAADTTKPGCSDIDPCKSGTFDHHPWKGRIVRELPGDNFLHHTDLCMRTCVGNFIGRYTTRLVERGGRWLVEPTNQGTSGFKIDGTLSAPSSELHLQR